MQGVSLYPEQNDIKVYLEKVSKVFQKMEKDLGTYRLKDNEPEKLLKMLKKVTIHHFILYFLIITLESTSQ